MLSFDVEIVRPGAILPAKGTEGSVGFDLTNIYTKAMGHDLYMLHTGLAIKPPEGMYAQLVARSSLYKSGLSPATGHGVIDPDYRGEIKFVVKGLPGLDPEPHDFDMLRFGQLVFAPAYHPEYRLVSNIPDTERGEGGFGSTG